VKKILLAAVLVFSSAAFAADEAGFVPLFNGKDLKGWRLMDGAGKGYVVNGDGTLECPPGGGGRLLTEKEYSDFVFRFEFKLTKGANNGVGIRTPFEGDAAYAGMEIQILDDQDEQYKGWLRPEQHHGSVYDMIPARTGFRKPLGDWNSEEIYVKGRHIRVTLNGVILVDTSLDIVREPEVLKKHPGLARTSGHVGFLGHNSQLWFRNVRIKALK
jgi:hypothetical protein